MRLVDGHAGMGGDEGFVDLFEQFTGNVVGCIEQLVGGCGRSGQGRKRDADEQ